MAAYLIEGPNGTKNIVECRTAKSAIAHIASKDYKATTLKTSELLANIKAGVPFETVAEEKSPEQLPGTQPLTFDKPADVAAVNAAKKDQAQSQTPKEAEAVKAAPAPAHKKSA